MWQRLFVAILFLVILAQITPLVLISMEMPSREEKREREVGFICATLAANLEGRYLSDASMYMDYFNGAGPELWFEGPDGTVLAGVPVPGFSRQDRRALEAAPSPLPGTRIWRGIGTWNNQAGLPLDLLGAPVTFKDAGPATLFIIYPNYRIPKVSEDFYKVLAILVLAGALISYAVSRHLARPLRRLQQEVLAIDEKSLDRELSLTGTEEVASVARAVNHLTSELGRHTRNMKGLVANISHELRSPLARMTGHADFIEDGFDRASHRVEVLEARLKDLGDGGGPLMRPEDLAAVQLGLRHLAFLKEALGHMDNLVGTTLLASRLDLNRTPPPFRPVDLSGLCQELLGRRRLFMGNRGIEFTPQIGEGIRVSGDRILLGQMLSNLLDNAVNYVSDQGDIRLELSYGEEDVRFRIENTHPPVPKKDLIRLFEPFFRAGKATGTGVGLGLSLVKKIADLHGGRVSAVNTDTGLCLEVVLPRPGS